VETVKKLDRRIFKFLKTLIAGRRPVDEREMNGNLNTVRAVQLVIS
jgi:hypothetical protein